MFKKRGGLNRSYSGTTSSSSSSGAAPSATARATCLAVECIGSGGGALSTGDVVEEIQVGNQVHRSPFKDGMASVQKLLRRCFKERQISITLRALRRSGHVVDLQAFIMETTTSTKGKTEYVLRGIHDPQYVVRLLDRTQSQCYQLQDSSNKGTYNARLTTNLKDGYMAYPWERKMQGMLEVHANSSSFISILFLPHFTSDFPGKGHDIDDTLTLANAWLKASQASGVPIVLTNVQTESFLTKVSSESGSNRSNVSSLADLSKVANASLYGFEDYHGIDIGVVRGVRLWYAPAAEECRVVVQIHEGDSKLGFAISRTDEGFIYIVSVIEGDEEGPWSRSGLSNLHKEATKAGKLLVISMIDNQRVLPWLVSPSGSVRCFDTVSVSEKLSLYRHAAIPLLIHLFMCPAPPPPSQLVDRDNENDSADLYYDPVLIGGQKQQGNCDGKLQDNDDDDAIQVKLLERSAGDNASSRLDPLIHFTSTNTHTDSDTHTWA